MARHEMAGRKLAKNVFAGGQWYGPSYPEAGDPPPGLITNPTVFAEGSDAESSAAPPMDVQVTVHDAEGVTREGTAKAHQVDDEASTEAASADPPPRAGAGSGRGKWVEYAAAQGVEVGEHDTREDIIDACEQAGVATE